MAIQSKPFWKVNLFGAISSDYDLVFRDLSRSERSREAQIKLNRESRGEVDDTHPVDDPLDRSRFILIFLFLPLCPIPSDMRLDADWITVPVRKDQSSLTTTLIALLQRRGSVEAARCQEVEKKKEVSRTSTYRNV